MYWRVSWRVRRFNCTGHPGERVSHNRSCRERFTDGDVRLIQRRATYEPVQMKARRQAQTGCRKVAHPRGEGDTRYSACPARYQAKSPPMAFGGRLKRAMKSGSEYGPRKNMAGWATGYVCARQ